MKNFCVVTVFVLSLFAAGVALKAQADQRPQIQPGLSTQVPVELLAKAKKDGGEESEEEFAPRSESLQALRSLQPGALDRAVQVGAIGAACRR